MDTEGGEPRKVEGRREQKLSELLMRLRWLVTTIAALWNMQDLTNRRETGLPHHGLTPLQPVPHPESRAGP